MSAAKHTHTVLGLVATEDRAGTVVRRLVSAGFAQASVSTFVLPRPPVSEPARASAANEREGDAIHQPERVSEGGAVLNGAVLLSLSIDPADSEGRRRASLILAEHGATHMTVLGIPLVEGVPTHSRALILPS